MTYLLLGAVGLAVAAVAAVYPYLPAVSRKPAGIDRADWVTRLFALAAQADSGGDDRVASAARSLISALVMDKPSRG